MKVKVKIGCAGFFAGVFRKEGDVFEIKSKQHSTKKLDNGKPAVITEAKQFSAKWMEKVKTKAAKVAADPESEEEKTDSDEG